MFLQAVAVGQSALAQSILGSWQKAPKLARDDYERFIKAVSSLLGGEASTEEVQEAASIVWQELKDVSPSAQQLEGRGSAKIVQAYK